MRGLNETDVSCVRKKYLLAQPVLCIVISSDLCTPGVCDLRDATENMQAADQSDYSAQ